MTETHGGPRTLAIDIGGTGLKMLVLDPKGQAVDERARVPTPRPATPEAILAALSGLLAKQPPYDRISVGFPGVVHEGVVATAPNLDPSWHGVDLAAKLGQLSGKPTRVGNDADVQGLADVEGKGVEMVLTLGTGLGSALFLDGKLVPNLELGHHPFRGHRTYEEYVGKAALAKVGKKRWRRRVCRMIAQLEPIWNYRLLHLGGGNAKLLDPESLPKKVRIHSNEAGMLGGIYLWR